MSEQMELDRLKAARLEVCKPSDARKRLEKLFDGNSFVELDAFTGGKAEAGGVVTGYGEIGGATVFAFSQDVRVRGGAVGKAQAAKVVRLYDMALKTGCPVIGIYDSKGGAVGEGNDMLAACGQILSKVSNLSGVVPQISLVLGVCGGIAAMTACAADFVVMSRKAELFLTPPANARDKAGAGAAETALRTGAAQIVEEDEEAAIAAARKLASMLPANNLSAAAGFDFEAPASVSVLDGITGRLNDTAKCDVTRAIVDEGSFLLLSNGFGQGGHTALAALGGTTVGVVGTGGALDHDGAARIARFVSVCDSFQIPVITLINTAGVLASGQDELAGAVRDMARLAHVYAEATTPKVAIVTGEAIGSAYIALSQADVVLAWPGAVVSAMPVPAAVAFLKGAQITKDHPREAVEAEYRAGEAGALTAAAAGYVQDIIAPSDTRETLLRTLDMLSSKRVSRLPKKHSNLPM